MRSFAEVSYYQTHSIGSFRKEWSIELVYLLNEPFFLQAIRTAIPVFRSLVIKKLQLYFSKDV